MSTPKAVDVTELIFRDAHQRPMKAIEAGRDQGFGTASGPGIRVKLRITIDGKAYEVEVAAPEHPIYGVGGCFPMSPAPVAGKVSKINAGVGDQRQGRADPCRIRMTDCPRAVLPHRLPRG